MPAPEIGRDRNRGDVLYVDSFGNIALNLTREHASGVGDRPRHAVELEVGGERYFAVAARTFADARAGDVILYEDSYRNMSLAISGGSAAEMLQARPGQSLRISVLRHRPDSRLTGLSDSCHKGVRGTVSPARTSFSRAHRTHRAVTGDAPP